MEVSDLVLVGLDVEDDSGADAAEDDCRTVALAASDVDVPFSFVAINRSSRGMRSIPRRIMRTVEGKIRC